MVKAAGVVGRAATGAVVGTGKLFGDLVALTADLIAWTGVSMAGIQGERGRERKSDREIVVECVERKGEIVLD